MEGRILLRAAPALGLRAEALKDLANGWRPRPAKLENVRVFSSAREGGSPVNAYLAWDPESNNGVVFVTGTDARHLIEFASERHIRLQMVLITHSHRHPVAELSRIIGVA